MSDPRDERDEAEEKGFTVKDRRRFDAEGNTLSDAPPGEQPPVDHALPEIDFSTFILSLGTSVMVHLGETPEGAQRKDLLLAKQTIDILGLLRQKTEGNLTDDEARLLDELLYDLRLRYVAATR